MLWAAGVAASPIARSLGVPLDRAGRVTPEPTLALAAHPDIFVVGDLCVFVQDGKPLPGVAQVAMQQGARAGQNVLRAIAGQPLEPFRYKDYGIMATIGRGAAVGDVFGLKISGFVALAVLDLPAHLLADRLPQPLRRHDRVGVGVLHAAAPRAADHR